jgi:hypothetical protein
MPGVFYGNRAPQAPRLLERAQQQLLGSGILVNSKSMSSPDIEGVPLPRFYGAVAFFFLFFSVVFCFFLVAAVWTGQF